MEARGPRTLKGVTAPVDVYRVVRPSGVRGRLAAAVASARTLTPFVGRDEERRLLQDRFEQARDGNGQVVLLLGEPGIGKSRLIQMLREDLAGTPHTWLEAGGQPYFADTPFYALTDLLKQFFAWRPDDTADMRVAALAQALDASGIDSQGALPLVAPLLDLAVPADYAPVLAAADVARKRLVATLSAWTVGSARRQPMVMLLEDLHWIDASTLELQQLLVDQSATVPLLLVYTARPEFRTPWPLRSHHTQITLNRLSAKHTRALVRAVAAQALLPTDMMETVIARTDGVPLFAEELTKAALEAGTKAAAAIPMTLADSLMARLDRLGPHAKEVAQIGAAIGREFSYVLIAAVAETTRQPPLSELQLQDALGRLIDAELVYVRGLPPEATYTFKHALVQDTAYGSLLTERRRTFHSAIAARLSASSPATVESQPELLAYHHMHAGETEPAIDAWQRAGERALRRGEASAAVAHFRQVLALVAMLPEGVARDEHELRAPQPLGSALTVVKGYTSSEALVAHRRAHELSVRGAESTAGRSIWNLIGLWGSAVTRDGPVAARPFAEEIATAAQCAQSPELWLWSDSIHLSLHYHAGNLTAAQEHAARALALCTDETGSTLPIGLDVRVTTLTYAAWVAWSLGYADRARRLMHESLAQAERSGRPSDRSWAASFAAITLSFVGDHRGIAAHVAATIEACAEEANPFHATIAKIMGGWAAAEQGNAETAIETIRSGLDEMSAAGHRLSLELHMGHLADALTHAGRFEEALRTLAEAEGACPGEEVDRAATLRRRAELLARTGTPATKVEATFQSALAVARRQGAKSYELRVATRYGLWLRDHGRARETRELVAPLYAAFTEGFDTPDLIDAKAQLAESR